MNNLKGEKILLHQWNHHEYFSKNTYLSKKLKKNNKQLNRIDVMLHQLRIASDKHRKLIQQRSSNNNQIIYDVRKRRLEISNF